MPDPQFPQPLSDWLSGLHQAVLITIRADGTPQSSNIGFAFDPVEQEFRISVTADRAKTRNLQRDPRCALHVLGPTFWAYLSVRAEARLSAVTSTPGDAVGQELLRVYEAAAGKLHPDPDEFFAAMVAEQRLVLTLRAASWSGAGLPT